MAGPNEIDPPQPTPFEALVRRLAEEAIETETVSVDDLLNGGRLTSRYLERFARLVAEECAKVADADAQSWGEHEQAWHRHSSEAAADAKSRCGLRRVAVGRVATKIRAKFRGE